MPVPKKINKNFFKKWTPEMSYVLGFFAADGYITVNRRGGQFWCIQIKDGNLLKEIKKTIQAEHKISLRFMGNSCLYRLQIGSFEMCNDLRKLGMRERKTKSLAIPHVPKEYFPDFVRGYFDGDGNVWSGRIHKDRKKQHFAIRVVFTSCSVGFLKNLKENLYENGIDSGVLSKGKGDYFRLTYSICDSLKLYSFMYNQSSSKNNLFLSRKKIVFEKYIKLRNAPVAQLVSSAALSRRRLPVQVRPGAQEKKPGRAIFLARPEQVKYSKIL